MRFLMVDRIVAAERGKRIHAVKTVGEALPSSMIVEGLAQLGGMLNLLNHRFAVEMLLALLDGVRVPGRVRQGDVLDLHVAMLYDHPYGATMRGAGRVGEAEVATVDRMVYAHEVITDEGAVRSNRRRFAYHGGVV